MAVPPTVAIKLGYDTPNESAWNTTLAVNSSDADVWVCRDRAEPLV